MILTAGKYSDVQQAAQARPSGAPKPSFQILVPNPAARRTLLKDWWWKEIKEGGFLFEYVRREKGRMAGEIRKVARLMANFKPNHKSDLRLVARVPARLAQRLKHEDPDFFSDNQNLKNLKRDNPDVCVYL